MTPLKMEDKEKIQQLAEILYGSRLAASMTEAAEKATTIIQDAATNQQGNQAFEQHMQDNAHDDLDLDSNKPLNELLGEERKEEKK